MTQKKKMTFEEAWNAKPDGRTREELYQSIVERIKKKYNNEISDTEAHEAARNLIGFCEELVKFRDKITTPE